MFIFTNQTTAHLKPLLRARLLKTGRYTKEKFKDKQRWYSLLTKVKRQNTAVVASILPDPETFLDLISLHRLLKEERAQSRIIVITYFAYARQDVTDEQGRAAIGMMMAEIIRNTNPTAIHTIDIHSDKIQKMLGPDAKKASAIPLFAKELQNKGVEVLVAPDKGAIDRVNRMATIMNGSIKKAYIEKSRPRVDVVKATSLSGDVKDKHVAIVDDMITTGATITEAVRLLRKNGAKKITVCATHGIFTNNARTRLARLGLAEIIVANTIKQIRSKGFKTINIAPLIKKLLES